MKQHEKYERVLSWLNRNEWKNQRVLAEQTKMSLGTINQLLKELIEEKYLEKQEQGFVLTAKGEHFLSMSYHERQSKKLVVSGNHKKIRKAVILAAGDNQNFDCPEGLLRLADMTLMDRTIHVLKKHGIEEICMVVGAKEDQYRSYYAESGICFVSNPKYKWTGTMHSLSLAAEFIDEDFLLVESNQIFDESAIISLLKEKSANAMLLTVPSGSWDEAYVELDKDRSVFRISKDIRQMNRIDGEAVGICKISEKMFRKMRDYFEGNTNPMLNYEYVLEGLGRTYGVQGVLVNDLVWTIVETQQQYRHVLDRIYPEILKREATDSENKARQVLKDCMNLSEQEIGEVRIGGGMTNTNYFVNIRGESYILRIPGACTDEMINRETEYHNSEAASKLNINPESIYFDVKTGVKITRCIQGAVTFSGKTARLEHSIRSTTKIIRTLHESSVCLKGEFSVLREYEKYKTMINRRNIQCYDGFEEMDRLFYMLMKRLDELGWEKKPCHNDLVPENFVMSDEGKVYLIDWEYSGSNDPMWDVASHLLECEFTADEEELFLSYYFGEEAMEPYLEKILIFKICQDILWSAWTVLKEYDREDFGTYGTDRLARAIKLGEEYQKRYGKKE